MLCFYGLNRSLLATTENLYLAAGKPEVRTKLNLLQLVLMAVLMYPLTIRYGIMGAAITVMLPSILVVVLTLHEAGKIIGENLTYIARNFVPGIIGSLIMVLSIWGWQNFVDTSSSLFVLVRCLSTEIRLHGISRSAGKFMTLFL
jgi:lipopolysaccharide exporter